MITVTVTIQVTEGEPVSVESTDTKIVYQVVGPSTAPSPNPGFYYNEVLCIGSAGHRWMKCGDAKGYVFHDLDEARAWRDRFHAEGDTAVTVRRRWFDPQTGKVTVIHGFPNTWKDIVQ